jgi:hypothetical protein
LSIVPFSLPGRFWRGNLHTHSTLSDGALAPERAIEAYKDAGYDFIQLSDHFMERFNWPIADTRRWRSNNFTTLIGAELHAPATSVGELWHILAAGLPLDFAAPTADESGPELAARATAHGAFVAIAHPAWSQLTIEDGRSLGRAHAVEIYNHGCKVETDRGDGFYLMDQLLNEGRPPSPRTTPIFAMATMTRSAALSKSRPKASSRRRRLKRSRRVISTRAKGRGFMTFRSARRRRGSPVRPCMRSP